MAACGYVTPFYPFCWELHMSNERQIFFLESLSGKKKLYLLYLKWKKYFWDCILLSKPRLALNSHAVFNSWTSCCSLVSAEITDACHPLSVFTLWEKHAETGPHSWKAVSAENQHINASDDLIKDAYLLSWWSTSSCLPFSLQHLAICLLSQSPFYSERIYVLRWLALAPVDSEEGLSRARGL